jgi:Holliday junction resolvasome RuvABC endonuclease subunit
MPRIPLTILGINPGSRYLGTAIFHGTELRDWGVKVIEGRWSKEKLGKARMIVSTLIEQYEPDVLAIKRLHPSRSSPSLNLLVGKIKELAKRKSLRLYQYSIKELESFFSKEERINKKRLAEIITSEYPELLHELEKEKSHKNPYHIKMFEAVALGKICFQQLDK